MESEGAGPGRRPTIYDVAALADVAPSTVSRALSRPGRVSAVTAQKVRDAAAELGYRRSSAVPALNQMPTRLLAMVVADIGNPLFVDVIRGAEAAGYTMLLLDSQESDVRERRAVEAILDAVEGLILASPRLSDSGIRALAKQRPTIVLNRVVTGLPSVLTDGARGVRRAAEHLGQLGHREITYIGGPRRPGLTACAGGAWRRPGTSSSCGCGGSVRTSPASRAAPGQPVAGPRTPRPQ